jgi:excisionase family DNA binding protein
MRRRQRTYTISEAAEATGLSREAVRSRIRRGSLASLLVDGERRIPRAELERAGLMDSRPQGAPEEPDASSVDLVLSGVDQLAPGDLVRELVDRLERQAVELERYREFVRTSGHAELLDESAALRSRISALEVREPRLALPSGATSRPEPAVPETPPRRDTVPAPGLWLPPGSDRVQPAQFPQASEPDSVRRRPAWRAPAIRLAAEVALILAVAAGAAAADLSTAAVVGVVAVAWGIVAAAEFAGWSRDRRA